MQHVLPYRIDLKYYPVAQLMYMLGAKYGFAQSMVCAAQTMDPYFVQGIHGLCVQVCLNLNFFILF